MLHGAAAPEVLPVAGAAADFSDMKATQPRYHIILYNVM